MSGPVLARPAPVAVRVVAARLLAAALEARVRLGDDGDPEALHDFRVALRRLRSWLRAFRPWLEDTVRPRHLRRVGRIARSTGELRDAEVIEALLARMAHGARQAPVRRAAAVLRERIVARRASAGRVLARAARDVDELREPLAHALSRWSAPVERKAADPPFSRVLAATLRAQADALEEALAGAATPDRQAEAHAARIAGKRLRSLLEPLRGEWPASRECVTRLKSLQDLLGDMHDAHVLAVEASALAAARSPRARGGVPAQAFAGLASLVAARVLRLHATLRREWLAGGGAASLLRRVRVLSAALERRPDEGMEHERKYLLASMPPRALAGRRSLLEQGWLPGRTIMERLRKEKSGGKTRHWRTIKAGRGISRIEAEEEVPAGLFRSLWPLTAGRRVLKERFTVRSRGATWEIDRFLDRDLVLAEIELPSADADVALPAWLQAVLVREVTGEDAYVNRNLAT